MDIISLDVYDYAGKKLTNLYDSSIASNGSARHIQVVWQLAGTRTLSFDLPYMIDAKRNWRWNYIYPEYKVRVRVNETYDDWFIITNPKKEKSSNKISQTITCDHLSTILKTKNLYLAFDQDNGIGTAQYLMDQILAGTGWSYDAEGSDTFYENHATTNTTQEKKRSLQSDGKAGAYSLIGEVCDLFNAYPIFDAVHKTVQLHDLNDKEALKEMIVGVNLTGMSAEYDSSNIITRLYVEGDYDDDGAYVGIDDVNPTGLNYLMNFDYYKSIGAFTEDHEAILQKYYADVLAIRGQTLEDSTQYTQNMSDLISLWGTQNYILWQVTDGQMTKKIVGGTNTVSQADKVLDVGDKMYVFWHDDTLSNNPDRYQIVDVTINTSYQFDKQHYPFIGDHGVVTHVLKWVTGCSGSIGAKEAKIEAKQQIIDDCVEQNKGDISDSQRTRNNEMIATQKIQIEAVQLGDSSQNYETFDYSVKIKGTNEMTDGDAIDCTIIRKSTNSIISTTTYKLKENIAAVETDDTAFVYQDGVRLLFGDYGWTQPIEANDSAHSIVTNLVNFPATFLNINTAGTELTLGVEASDKHNTAVKFVGTTFTFSIEAKPYSLFEQYAMAIGLAEAVDAYKSSYDKDIIKQKQIEAQFIIDMGDMLRDGYWTDDNYISGQQQFLYNDALDVMKQVSKPKVTYSVSLLSYAMMTGQTLEDIQLNSKIRIYDPQLKINDNVYVSKITRVLDDPSKSSIEISNEQVDVSSNFDSIFSRINDIAKVVQQKKTMYDRAEAINSSGSLATQRLEGMIDTMATQLGAAVSSWYTDDNGNIIFESADGRSAMKLCGQGFAIANSKNSSGDWRWRTCGTGDGLVADTITTGYLSADRIEAQSITTNKLASDVGSSLNLSSNKSIHLAVQDVTSGLSGYMMKITSDAGNIFTDEVQVITLKSKLTFDDEDVTEANKSLFVWAIDNEVKYTGVDTITLSSSDIGKNAQVACFITKDVSTGQLDRHGNEVMVSRTFIDNMTLVNMRQHQMSLYLNTGLSRIQTIDSNTGACYNPWLRVNGGIQAVVVIDGQYITRVDDVDGLQLTWYEKIDDQVTEITDNDFYDISFNKTNLSFVQNVMQPRGLDHVTFVCTAMYNGLTASDEIDFKLVKTVEKSKACSISGANVFTLQDGIPNPNSITLRSNVVNVKFKKWMRLVDNTWVDVFTDGNELKIAHDSPYFNGGDEIKIKAVSDDINVFDVITIHKVTNTDTNKDDLNYHTYIRYSQYNDGKNMVQVPTAETKYIGSYAGPAQEAPDKSQFHWSKYAGSGANSSAITIQSTVLEYNQVPGDTASVPLDDDPNWTQTMPQPMLGSWMWTRTTIEFSNGFIMKDYRTTKISTNKIPVSHVFVRYSANEDGRNMTIYPDIDTAFIGIYTGTSSTAPSNYKEYRWTKLVADDGKIGGTNNIQSVEFYHAVTTTNVRPQSDSALWQDLIPEINAGEYLWTKAYITFTDGSHDTNYNVSYSGTNGENTTTFVLSDEHLNIGAGSDGTCQPMTLTTRISAYNGTTKVIPVINEQAIQYHRGDSITPRPNGMSVSIGNINTDSGSSEYNDVTITITIADGSNLGSASTINGQIYIPVSVMNNGVNQTDVMVIEWQKNNKRYTNSEGKNFVSFDVYSNLYLLKNNMTSTIRSYAYFGSQNLANIAQFKWQIFRNGAWFDYTGNSSQSTISSSDVNSTEILKCIMIYNGDTYARVCPVVTDNCQYTAIIYPNVGYTFDGRAGETTLVCKLYQNGVPYRDLGKTYKWSRIDKNGNIKSISGSGSSISISSSAIDDNTFIVCEPDDQWFVSADSDERKTQTCRAAIKLKRQQTEMVVSDTAPINPNPGDVWYDTSGKEAVLKKYMAPYETQTETFNGGWVVISTQADAIVQNVITSAADIYATKDSLNGYVSRSTFDANLGQINEQISNMELTPDTFRLMFNNTVSDQIYENIYKQQNRYLEYDGNTGILRLGSDGDENETFRAQLGQKRLSFKYMGTKGETPTQVAYIGVNDMYITNARVTEALYIGDVTDGYFMWVVTDKGLGLKYVGVKA